VVPLTDESSSPTSRLLDPQYEGTTFLRKAGNRLLTWRHIPEDLNPQLTCWYFCTCKDS